MDIKIKETGELSSLSIIDTQTGCEWTQDLLGNYDAEMIFDEDAGVHIMDKENFAWWEDLINRYQAAYNYLSEVRSLVDNPEDLDAYLIDMAVGSCELENYPESLTDAVNDWLSDNK